MPSTAPYKYLDPEALSRLKNLSLAAKQVSHGHVKAAEKDLSKAATLVHEAMKHEYHVPATPPVVGIRR